MHPQRIEHFEILELLGQGGMGVVYLAQDTSLDRKVAIKVLPESAQLEPKAQARLVREAKAAASLDHPFICKVFEAGQFDGSAYIVMEYVPGQTLEERLEEGALSASETLRVALEVAEALSEAHEKDLVHRDLKPANIMLTPQGHVKVMDFGLARRVFRGDDDDAEQVTQSKLTREGAIVGTISYMAPEQTRGLEADQRSDVFSLGIVMHEMVSGSNPFLRDSAAETLSAILRDAPEPLEVESWAVSSEFDEVVQRALSKDPGDRYQSSGELAADLRRLELEVPAFSARSLLGWPAVAAVVVVFGLLFASWWIGSRTPRVVETPEPMSVLVADFENTTGDPAFEGAIEQSLGISLDGAPYLSVFKRPDARRLAGELDAEAQGLLDSRLARLVSRSAGINIVVEGTVEGAAGDYRVTVRALDAATFEEVTSASSQFDTKAEFNRAVYEVASELVSDLGAVPAELAEAFSLETFTTSSLEAMNAYARAQELVAQGRDEEAITAYEEAIQADDEFGRAYSGLATVYFNRGERARGQDYYAQAMAHIDRMSEREKHRTRGVYYLMNADFENAIEEYTALVEQYPADGAGFVNLALAHFYSRNLDLAVEVGRRSVELIPSSIDPRSNLTWYSLMAGEFELCEQQAGELVEQHPEFDPPYVPLAMAQLMLGRPAEDVRQTYGQLRDLGGWSSSIAVTGLADLALYEGRLDEAEQLLRPGIEADLVAGLAGLASHKQIILAETLLAHGHTQDAMEVSRSATAANDEIAVVYPAALLSIAAGSPEAALEAAAALGEQLQPEPRAYGELIEGEVSLQAGDTQEAIAHIREAQQLLDTWLGHLTLARAYLQAEAYMEAHDELDICWERRGEATSAFFNDSPTLRYVPQVHYYMGRALEGMGSPAAADSYRIFLDIKAAATVDPRAANDPMIADARRRLEGG